MKAILAFTLLVAGICASIVPKPSFHSDALATRNSRFSPVENMVIEAIEDLSQDIRDAGLDPFFIDRETYSIQLPVPVIFNAAANLEELLFFGLSDIVINRMNYNLLGFRLDFELELPHLEVYASSASGAVTLFGRTLSANGNGRVDIQNAIARGEANISLGVTSGISISSVNVDVNIGRIRSNLKLAFQGDDYSQEINNFISSTIPNTIQEFNAEINELVGIILLDYLNENFLG